jgi:hypothetical protein
MIPRHKLGRTSLPLTKPKSRAEQSRAEQSRAEQSRAEQSRAEQSRAEQSLKQAEGMPAMTKRPHSDQLWLCGLIPHSALVGVREYDGKNNTCASLKADRGVYQPR